jgi:orotate phosphoribosyltransferase
MGTSSVISSLTRQRINFRSIADMDADILKGIPRLPRSIDLVVGIPRSGMLAASILALHLNCALTDVDGLLNGRIFTRGHSRRGLFTNISSVDLAESIMVLDDSVYRGAEMDGVRRLLSGFEARKEILFAAVYVSEQSRAKVDFYFNVCQIPRIFEWNLMHHSELSEACIDMDGVLCRDPTEEENDDGPKYQEFLSHAERFLLPTVPVGYVVTCRLEKHRLQTESWLARHNVKYKRLIMMDLPSKAARIAAGSHGAFKANACRHLGANLFIESDEAQALEIANRASVDVFCVKTQRLIHPAWARERLAAITNGPRRLRQAVRRMFLAAQRILITRRKRDSSIWKGQSKA